MRNNNYNGNNLLSFTNKSPQARRVTEKFIQDQGGIEKLREAQDWGEVREKFIAVIQSTPVEEQ